MRNNKIEKISVKKILKINNEKYWKRIDKNPLLKNCAMPILKKTQNLNYSNECIEKIKI